MSDFATALVLLGTAVAVARITRSHPWLGPALVAVIVAHLIVSGVCAGIWAHTNLPAAALMFLAALVDAHTVFAKRPVGSR